MDSLAAADLALLVATPLAIVPLVALAAQRFSPEQIFIIVTAFASIGHHLPGFLRAYGDRELFARFRWRFLLAPPLVLMVSLAFTWNDLHGLELVLLLWATWHIMMQTYGFMRIYDLKRGVRDAVTARLDFLLCCAVFALGIVFSQARVYGIVEVLLRIGLPLPAPAWLVGGRWAIGILAAVIGGVYLAHTLYHWRNRGINPIKILLVLATAWLYWVCGSLTTNLLVGVAMFEIFHALQYFAIVWSYNRKLADRVGERFGPLGFLFRQRWFLLPLYIAAIAAFGSLRLFSEVLSHPALQKILLAVLATSTLLHFYYDGFIWKVSERTTQRNLGIDQSGRRRHRASGYAHAGKWAMLAAAGCLLLYFEIAHRFRHASSEPQMLAALAAWAPQLPELQTRVSRAALARGESEEALAVARRALAAQPRSPEAQAAVGAALLNQREFPSAAAHLHEAVRLAPHVWQSHYDLAQALSQLDQWQPAADSFARAAALAPDESCIRVKWGEALSHVGQRRRAHAQFCEAVRCDPASAEAHFQLGLCRSQQGQHAAACESLSTAVLLAPNHGVAHFELGNVQYRLNRPQEASQCFRRSSELLPRLAAPRINLGAALFELNDCEGAAHAYAAALAIAPDDAAAHYNLGLVQLSRQKLAQARHHFYRAKDLGLPPDAHVQTALDGAAP